MKAKILAVSGGVDSVVMLDMIIKTSSNPSGISGPASRSPSPLQCKTLEASYIDSGDTPSTTVTRIALGESLVFSDVGGEGQLAEPDCPSALFPSGKGEIVVAHFNHGIREDSDDDEEFVRGLAEKYGVKFESRKENLGAGASEELARERRYGFLREVARKYGGRVYTAHHRDDLVETVAINLIRGTGWRGLVPLDSPEFERPMLGMTKREIIDHATKNGLRWREDSTNESENYLRNRVRKRLGGVDNEVRDEVVRLYERQKELKREIEGIIGGLLNEEGVYEREELVRLDEVVAMEVLRGALMKAGVRVTRVQLRDFWEAIRGYETGKMFNLPEGRLVRIGKTIDLLGIV